MLCLRRRNGQRVFLTLPDGREIEILVKDARAGYVRIYIGAPADVAIRREDAQPKQAASS